MVVSLKSPFFLFVLCRSFMVFTRHLRKHCQLRKYDHVRTNTRLNTTIARLFVWHSQSRATHTLLYYDRRITQKLYNIHSITPESCDEIYSLRYCLCCYVRLDILLKNSIRFQQFYYLALNHERIDIRAITYQENIDSENI